MKLIEQKVLDYAIDKNMLSRNDKIVVGVSGGADSVCLIVWLSAMRERYNLDITAVHVHHGIRGAEADEDMEYTSNLCEKLDVELVIQRYDVPAFAKENKMSEEEAGRQLRYDTFRQVLSDRQFNKIAVAHHSEDSAETILFNMIRGSRAKGLRGIASVNDEVIRPLMCLTRAEIEQYLFKAGISWRNDSTNILEEYSRNRIRETIIPAMQMINSQAVEHILETGNFIGELYDYLKKNVEELYTKVVTSLDRRLVFDIKGLLDIDRLVRLEIFRKALGEITGSLKDITSAHIEAVDGLLWKQSGRQLDLPYNIEVKRAQSVLYMQRKIAKDDTLDNMSACDIVVDTTKEGSYTLPGRMGVLHVRPITEEATGFDKKTLKFTENICTKFMDCDKIKDILSVRTRRSGDYLIVNQGHSKKKLKEYFIDNKIPIEERDKKLLLADGNHILWVLGYRMSDGAKLSADTRRQIEFKWEIYNTEEEYEYKD